MTDLDIIYHGEARLGDWGETRAGGKYIKLFLDDSDNDPLLPFRGLDSVNLKKTGHLFNLTISQGDIIAAPDKPVGKPFGHMAVHLFSNGFFLAPSVLAAIGSNDQYRHWIQRQPSEHSKVYGEYIDGDGRCEAAQVRRSSDTGIGHKPAYSCIPLTHEEHALQHREGESALEGLSFDRAKNKYLQLWGKETLAKTLGHDSIGCVPPDILCTWAKTNHVEQYLPRAYRNA